MTQEFRPYLPGVLAFIADEICVELAVRLAELKGGREIYIPKNPGPETSLAKLIGLENARQLFKLLGSGKLLVPAGNIGGQTGRRGRGTAWGGQRRRERHGPEDPREER